MSEKLYTCPKCGATGRSAHPYALMLNFTDNDWAFLYFTMTPPSIIMCAACYQGFRLTRFTDRIAGPADEQRIAGLLVFTLKYASENGSQNKSLNDMLVEAFMNYDLN